MEVFEANMNIVLKALLRLNDLHLSLFQLSNLKIINCEELSQSPYIKDELAQAKIELLPLKAEAQTVSEQAKEVIDHVPTLPLHRHQQQAILSRMITRALEAISHSPCEEELEYYQYYNQKFRRKCIRILAEIGHWQVFQVVWVLYKYFRHVTLIELERYEEILECMAQTDFQSVKYFRDYFYSMLKNKESKEKEAKREVSQAQSQKQVPSRPDSQNAASRPLIPLPNPVQNQTHSQFSSQRSIDPPSKLQDLPKLQAFSEQNETHSQTPSLLNIPPLIPFPAPSPTKGKSNLKSTKKLFSMLSSVMDIKRDHFVVDCTDKKWQERSIYSDLIGRNKINHTQIEEYYHYSQLMADRVNSTDGFYYYQEEPLLPDGLEQQLSAQRRRIKVHIPNDQYKKFLSCEPTRKQPSPQLTNPFQKRRQHRTVHKSINCRPRGEHPNAEIQQKPLKIDSQFLEINLRKVLPTRRQSQMQQMVIKASSLNNLRHDLHHKRNQIVTEKAIKDNNDVFKSVKILHQGQIDPKALKEVKEKTGHSRINSWINEQLKHGEYFPGKPEEVRKRMAFKKLDM